MNIVRKDLYLSLSVAPQCSAHWLSWWSAEGAAWDGSVTFLLWLGSYYERVKSKIEVKTTKVVFYG